MRKGFVSAVCADARPPVAAVSASAPAPSKKPRRLGAENKASDSPQQKQPRKGAFRNSLIQSSRIFLLLAVKSYPSRIGPRRVQAAETGLNLAGKHDTVKPVEGSCSRLCSFSMWQ